VTADRIEIEDVQGIAFYAYSEHPHALYLHVGLAPTQAKTYEWLRSVAREVRHAKHASDRAIRSRAARTVQVALTAKGLLAFGLALDDIAAFPRGFLLGMGDERRARVLGDAGEAAPQSWVFGAPGQDAIHAVLMLFARTGTELTELAAEQRARLVAAGGRVIHEDEAHALPHQREHFGFHDGISQPHIEGGPRSKDPREQSLRPGELLLGYVDEYKQVTPSPRVRGFDLGRNGTFVVYRKLEQRVGRFWREMHTRARPRQCETLDEAAVHLAASLVGRWPSGAPLSLHPHRDPGGDPSRNDFGYHRDDPDGLKCPFGAHTRRANPRDMLPPSPSDSLVETSHHRIFRRGRPYGAPLQDRTQEDGFERGLIFIALCADLRRQFEFVQQTWINSAKFAGLRGERDPLIGAPADASRRFTLPEAPVRRHIVDLPAFVTMRGGAYFFLPGMRALEWLATPR
jgi:Dyp-type peroxidase family